MRKLKTLFFTLFTCISACACIAFAACNEEPVQNAGHGQNQIEINTDQDTDEQLPTGDEDTPSTPDEVPPVGGQTASEPSEKDESPKEPTPASPEAPNEGEKEPTLPSQPAQRPQDPMDSKDPSLSDEPAIADPSGPPRPGEPQKHEHTFSDWYYDVDGYHMRYCPCGTKETEKCDMVPKIVPPTCTTVGYTLLTCTICKGQLRTDEVSTNGEHDWVYTVNYDTNGYSAGSMQHIKTCQNCGLTAGAEKCTFQSVEHLPTCTEDGFNRYTCTVCQNYYDASTFQVENGMPKPKKATGHTYINSWVHTIENGSNLHTKTCEVCGHVEKENCSFEYSYIFATCTQGCEISQRCKICGFYEVLLTQNPLGHLMSDPAPIGENNLHEQHCLRDGCTESIITECSFDRAEIVKEATCKEKGLENLYCACGRSKSITLFPMGHKLQNPTPSYGKGHSGFCKVCQMQVFEEHSYGTSNLCTVCGYDGLVYNYRYNVYVEECFQGSTKPNPVNKSARIIYISENAFSAYGDHYTTYGIGKNAFKDNKNLMEIYIPKCIRTIDPTAFDGCTSLKTIHFEGTEEEWQSIFEGNESQDISQRDGVSLVCKSYEYPKHTNYSLYNFSMRGALFKKRETY